jgi:hypothetical protein
LGAQHADQGFTITNIDDTDVADNSDGIGLCVTEDTNLAVNQVSTPRPCNANNVDGVITPAGAGIAQENIAIQNNRFLNNGEEGVVFFYNPPGTTAIDTIRILNNEFRQNGGSGLVFGNTVGAIGRRGLDRNVVIDGNTFDTNVQGDFANFSSVCDNDTAAIHFCNSGTVEQVAIVNNTIVRNGQPGNVGGDAGNPTAGIGTHGILFDQGIIEIRDLLIDRNVIHQNTGNGIKFDYRGRLGENVTISNNAKGTQGITQNGPTAAVIAAAATGGFAEGNGIYITANVTEVRNVKFVGNVINGNRGQDRRQFAPPGFPLAKGVNYVPCRHGNGISMENDGRIEDVTFDGNDFRQNFNNGVCIANRGDFTRSTVTNNKFHNNGFGEPIAAGAAQQAPYGDGFGVYHDQTLINPNVAALLGIDGFRIENITFSGNDYRENGQHRGGVSLELVPLLSRLAVLLTESTSALASAST